jgi:hypothetical protein
VQLAVGWPSEWNVDLDMHFESPERARPLHRSQFTVASLRAEGPVGATTGRTGNCGPCPGFTARCVLCLGRSHCREADDHPDRTVTTVTLSRCQCLSTAPGWQWLREDRRWRAATLGAFPFLLVSFPIPYTWQHGSAHDAAPRCVLGRVRQACRCTVAALLSGRWAGIHLALSFSPNLTAGLWLPRARHDAAEGRAVALLQSSTNIRCSHRDGRHISGGAAQRSVY